MKNAPRVLVLAAVLGQGVGGVQRHNQELLPRVARRLEELGGSLSLLEGTAPPSFELPANIERIREKIRPRPVLRRALAEGHAVRRVLAARAAEGRPFHLVHTAHQPVPRGLNTPLTVLIHDLRSLRGQHSPFSRRLFAREILGRAVRSAARLMTVSEAMAEEISCELGVALDALTIVPNGGGHFTPLPRATETDAALLCVGHLEPRKNQELLLRALATDEALPAVQFVGAAKGAELERLQTLAARLGVSNRTQFLGAVDDEQLLKLYARASAVVLPSSIEGFGIVALEALLAQVPLAVSEIPAHMEVTEGVTPHFAGTPEACARAIREALQMKPAQLADLAQRALRFSWDESAAILARTWMQAAAPEA